ncbi:sigma-70 family RNA polymerase sigma factor [Conexibacter arvalis]|uniref:RNA polymerase sigma factor (Sigma-70 family) n=1 Tax=Conexibacter arvalis TaxID=912552 RepID=A0A840IEV2_9ACTN|nr:sigma-70 family RNA polymerase sigma factor [Conexibacter arvalis]MBB4662528.1 RNA polymerase sigma factor (sigma-70 family) [Conexibacter arvalis]
MGARTGRRRDGAEEVVLALVREHAGELLRFARRFSLCADDAQDAYQRALEILVRRLRASTVDNPLSYLRTIIRHEAYQVRVERERLLGREEVDVEAAGGEPSEDPAERAERFERLAHTAEALRRLKPQELTALTLRAEGLSYREICEREGWSYTRCNRAVTEGRKALLARLRAIESGAECERWLPALSAFADGEASAREITELRPHLRACAACRATLRGFHAAPRDVGAIVPPELLLPAVAAIGAGGAGGGPGRHLEALVHGALERLTASAVRFQGAFEALPGGKVAAVAASTVAVAGGGAAIERAATAPADSQPAPRVERVAASTVAPDAPASSQPISLPAPSAASQPTQAALPGLGPQVPEWADPSDMSPSLAFGEFGFEVRGSAAGAEADADADRSGRDPGRAAVASTGATAKGASAGASSRDGAARRGTSAGGSSTPPTAIGAHPADAGAGDSAARDDAAPAAATATSPDPSRATSSPPSSTSRPHSAPSHQPAGRPEFGAAGEF